MKRSLRVFLIAVILLIVLVTIPVASAILGRRQPDEDFELSGIHIVKDGIVTVGVVTVGPNAVALIDAGNDKSGKAILAYLSSRQLGPDAVSAILITHGHQDHAAAIHLFPKAQVMALEREAAMVEGREGGHGFVTRFMPVRPTGVKVTWPLRDGGMVTIGRVQIQVFAIPGHTPGSAAYLVDGVLFLGDSADIGRNGEIQGSPWLFSDNQAENRASLAGLNDRLLREGADVKAIAFAHSGVLTEGLAPLTAFARRNR